MQDNQGMKPLLETSICFNYSKNHLITKERMGALHLFFFRTETPDLSSGPEQGKFLI